MMLIRILILLLLLTGCATPITQEPIINDIVVGATDKINLEKELIKIEQDLAKKKNKRYKTIREYEKDGYKYSIDNIVKWGGGEIPEDIGYEIHITDVNGKIKTIKKMNKELKLITDWHEPTVATSTL